MHIFSLRTKKNKTLNFDYSNWIKKKLLFEYTGWHFLNKHTFIITKRTLILTYYITDSFNFSYGLLWQ